MARKVITINRQYGSNGRAIGRKLAEHLEIPFFDKDLLRLVKENCGDLSYKELLKLDERATGRWKYPVEDAWQMQGKYRYETMNDILFEAESKLIRYLAQEVPCVIIGRCSNYLLRNVPEHVSVYIFAPFEDRVKRVMERSHIGEKEAAKLINEIDKERRYYYNYHTDASWSDMSQYDLCIDSSRFTMNEIITMLTGLYLKWESVPAPGTGENE